MASNSLGKNTTIIFLELGKDLVLQSMAEARPGMGISLCFS